MSGGAAPAEVAGYLAAFGDPWPGDTPVSQVRFVVLDTETSGLNPRTDRILSIGAVAVLNGQIRLDDRFECLLRTPYNSASVTVHGITRDRAREGVGEREAVERFLVYLGRAVIVGHHVGHDRGMLSQAARRHFGVALANPSLDTMELALRLEADGAFAGLPPRSGFSLDSLAALFGIAPRDRHTAPGDALITARIFLRLLKRAERAGRLALGELVEASPG